MRSMVKIWNNNKGLILFIFLMLFFRSAIADWYHVPSGSMKPNILVGDRVWVDKLAYDVKIPFTHINLNRHNEPKRGDVIVFNSSVSDKRLIKRVIAVPGDIVAMSEKRLFINHQPLSLELSEPTASVTQKNNDYLLYFDEESYAGDGLASYKYRVQYHLNRGGLSTFGPIVVKPDHLWVMGDNRDNSADSRVIGLVPRTELVGRAKRVVISFDKNHYYRPRSERFMEKL